MQLSVKQSLTSVKDINIKYLLIALGFFLLLLIKWFSPTIYHLIINQYIEFLGNTSSFLLYAIDIKHGFIKDTFYFNNATAITIDRTFFDIKTIIGVLAIIFINASKKQLTYLVPVFFIWALLFNIIRICTLSYFSNQIIGATFNRDSFYLLFLYLFPIIFFGKDLVKKSFYKRTTLKAISLKIAASFFIYHLLRFIVIFFSAGNEYIANLLSDIVLNMSGIALNFLEYNVSIIGRVLFNKTTTITMGTPCIGIEIMLIFALVIIVGDQLKLKNIAYIIFGIFTIIILNALRVLILFIHIAEDAVSEQVLKMDHDIYNLVIYASIFGLWYYWFNSFSKKTEPI